MVPQCRQSRHGDTHFCSCRLAHGLSSFMFALLCSALLRHQFCVRSLLQAPDAPYASGSTCTMYAIYTFPMSNRVCNHCRCSSSQRSTPRRLTCASPQSLFPLPACRAAFACTSGFVQLSDDQVLSEKRDNVEFHMMRYMVLPNRYPQHEDRADVIAPAVR